MKNGIIGNKNMH